MLDCWPSRSPNNRGLFVIYWVKFDIPRKGREQRGGERVMRPNIRCLELRRGSGLIWLLLYHFPHQQITRVGLAAIMNILYRVTKNTKNNSASQRATSRLASAVIVMLLIFMRLRFLSFNDPPTDHLFQKMMFAPPYVQDISMMQHFCGEWRMIFPVLWIISTLTYFPGPRPWPALCDSSHEYASWQFHLSRIVTRAPVSRESLWRRLGMRVPEPTWGQKY